MSQNECLKIDLGCQHEAMPVCNRNAHRFAVRYACPWLPSCTRLQVNNQLEDDRYPLHGVPNEKFLHFIQCNNRTIEEAFGEMIGKLRNVMYANKALLVVMARILSNPKGERRGGYVQEIEIRRG